MRQKHPIKGKNANGKNMSKMKLSNGLRKYIRRQKLLIKNSAKTEDEKQRLVRELLDRHYTKAA